MNINYKLPTWQRNYLKNQHCNEKIQFISILIILTFNKYDIKLLM